MAEKLVLVGVIPEIVVIGPSDQVVWLSDTANLNRIRSQSMPISIEYLPGASGTPTAKRSPAPGHKSRRL